MGQRQSHWLCPQAVVCPSSLLLTWDHVSEHYPSSMGENGELSEIQLLYFKV